MQRNMRRAGLFILLALALGASTGCDLGKFGALGGTTFFGSFFGTFLGSLLGGQSTTQTVERFCYENGVAVDCSTIPTP